MNPDQAEVYAILRTRPVWLPEQADWMDPVAAKDLALLPTTTRPLVEFWMADARKKRKTLTRPGGYLISKLRNPDAALVASLAANGAHA